MTTVGNDRNWQGTQCPNLMTDTTGTYQYGVLIRADWGVTVFRRTLATNVYTTYDLSSDATAVAGLNLPTNPLDSHWAFACLIDNQQRLWIAGNSHSHGGYLSRPTGGLNYIRSAANDITTWTNLSGTYPPDGWPTAGAGVSATGKNIHTYHHFDRFPNGDCVWLIDQEDSLSSSRGRDMLAFRLPAGSGTSWSPLVGQGEFATTNADIPQGVTADRIYHCGIALETRATGVRVHMAGIWRLWDAAAGGGSTSEPPSQMKPWHLYSDNWTDSTSWKRMDGSSQTMPITWANSGAITNDGATISSADATATYNRVVGNVSVDASGFPHMVLSYQDTGTYLHCYWTGSAWTSENLLNAGEVPSIVPVRNNIYNMCQLGTRVFFSLPTSNAVRFRFGNAISGIFAAYPDPVLLRQGTCSVMIPDGDTPAVFEFGGHHRCTH